LILNRLSGRVHLGNAAREQAEQLAGELGGYPLAIAHYAGYALTSRITLSELLATFEKRNRSAEIWSNHSNSSIMQYEQRLKTVFDETLAGLTVESRELLDVLAFLNPDNIPLDLLQFSDGILPCRADLSLSSRYEILN
jgi:hypothetical protein